MKPRHHRGREPEAVHVEWYDRDEHRPQSERYRVLAPGGHPRDSDGDHRTIAQATLARDAEVTALSDPVALTADIIFQSLASRRAADGG